MCQGPGPGDKQGRMRAGARPGRGGVTRGRADARLELTNDTEGATDAFTAKKLPAGMRPSTEWERTGLRRTVPTADPQRSTGAGSAGAQGSGHASWRRRLAPHHREVVRRFFETGK